MKSVSAFSRKVGRSGHRMASQRSTPNASLVERESRKAAFTLIEMLIVVLVVVLLAGMTMRMAGVVARNNAISSTRAKVEKVAMACEEFKAIYGKYPPVSFYPDGSQPLEFEFSTMMGLGGDSVAKTLVGTKQGREVQWGDGDKQAKFFTFGLLSYFLPRYNGMAYDGSDPDGYPVQFAGVNTETNERYSKNALKQYSDYNKFADGKVRGDTERDLTAVRRILPILGGKLKFDGTKVESFGMIRSDPVTRKSKGVSGVPDVYTNKIYRILDDWDNALRYSSLPPYETFEIRSAGLDGTFDTRDDIIAGKE